MVNYSVIIPHFSNKGIDLLKRAVESIPCREDIQIIIIDNSPIQYDFGVFDNYCDVEIYFSDKNGGAGEARNIGLKHVKGKWVLFLDADDFFNANAFSVFDKYIDSNYDVVFFKAFSIISNTGEIANRNVDYNELINQFLNNNDEYSIRTRHVVPWAKLIRMTLISDSEINFDKVVAANDVMFATEVGVMARVIYADMTEVYCVTVTDGSITSSNDLVKIQSRFDVAIRKNSFLKQNGLKRNASVLFYIIQAKRYSKIAASKMILKALFSGNLFVGRENWYATYKKLRK